MSPSSVRLEMDGLVSERSYCSRLMVGCVEKFGLALARFSAGPTSSKHKQRMCASSIQINPF